MSEHELNTIRPNDAIIEMVELINSGDKTKFYNFAKKYCEQLSPQSAHRINLKRILTGKGSVNSLKELKPLPTHLKQLLNETEVVSENVFLNESLKILFDDLFIEWKNIEVYKTHNLGIRNKILFHGPTGNGKTTVARHLSKLTGLPFIEVKSDQVISSHIGATGKEIEKIFGQLDQPCILFWDEVDTIGRSRGGGDDSSATVENERMVNSILVNMEKMSNEVVFIGATNRKEALDTAFLRRFDVLMEIPSPSEPEKQAFLNQMVDYYKLPKDLVPQSIEGYVNFSEIKLMVVDKVRKYILTTLKNKKK